MTRHISCVAVATTLLACGAGVAANAARTMVTEGTNFSVHVAADGRAAIDVFGHLWTLPAHGGPATQLTDGFGDDRLPRWSPDGQRLAFQSFRNGSWDIWLADADGQNAYALTRDDADDREPVWVDDGRRLIFASDRLGNYDLWSIDVASGALKPLTDDPADDFAPAVTRDGQSIAFVSTRDGRPAYFVIRDGETRRIAEPGSRRLSAAAFSPDGARLAAVVPDGEIGFPNAAAHRLVTIDIATGDIDTLSPPEEDVFPFAPSWLDHSTLMYTADGGIRRRRLDDHDVTPLPFSVTVKTRRARGTRNALRTQTTGRGIWQPAGHPVSDDIVFSALGDLWRRYAGGQLQRLTDDAFVERDARYSRDGRWLLFISDRDGAMRIWLRDERDGTARAVGPSARGVRYPTMSPDGSRIAYLLPGPRGTQDFTLHVLDAQSGETRRLRSTPPVWPRPLSWSADGQHLLVAALTPRNGLYRDGVIQLVRINTSADSTDVLPLDVAEPLDTGTAIAPDGNRIALSMNGRLWVAPIEPDGSRIGAPELIVDALVDGPSWTNGGQSLVYVHDGMLERVNIASGRRESLPMNLPAPVHTDRPRLLIHAGRMFDGRGDDYLQDVDILIADGKIQRVAPHTDHPPGISVLDATDRSVLPGLIDHHVHFQPHDGEWVGRALLSFGITTVVEPGGEPYASKARQEAWADGRRLGPRLVFAGPQLDGKRRYFPFAVHINDRWRLEQELNRGRALGYALVKTYTRMPHARQSELIRIARRGGLPLTSHELYPALALGARRVEHLRGTSRHGFNTKQSDRFRSYGDVTALFAATRASLTPTIVVNGGFFALLRERPELLDNPQLAHFYSSAYRQGLAGLGRLLERRRDLLTLAVTNARATVLAVHENGGRIVAGTDAPIFPYGLSLVVELANYVDAGLSPADALRTATVAGAQELGAAEQLGTIAQGFHADLVVVDGDPLMRMLDLANVTDVIRDGQHLTREKLFARPTR